MLPGTRHAIRTSQRVRTHSYIQVNLVPLHTSTYPTYSYINILTYISPTSEDMLGISSHLSALLSPKLPTRKLGVGEKNLPEVLCFLCFL